MPRGLNVARGPKVVSHILRVFCTPFQGKLSLSENQLTILSSMKKEADLLPKDGMRKRKRKKAKGPNPLSCKKPKLKR